MNCASYPPFSAGNPEALSLSELCARVSRTLEDSPLLHELWVTGETSDLRLSRGHCYMDLLEKDASGTQLARMRAMIWARDYGRLSAVFEDATGIPLASDLKIMVKVRLGFHPVFGLSLTITDINPAFTAGDMVRRRNEIIRRLQAEGVYDLNRSLPWPRPCLRVAVVSARNAAGYGDFVRQLLTHPAHLRFNITLFEAALQGAHTAPAVIQALDRIAERMDDFDCVVIIRGGGAVADLVSFDDYSLAANVAQFPLPVVVGIGHDRDITVLDYVAARSARTPTAAAEFLLDMALGELGLLQSLASEIHRLAVDRLRGAHSRLARIQGELPALARGVIRTARQKVGPEMEVQIAHLSRTRLLRSRERLDALEDVLRAVGPEATLRRGFSITRVDGKALTDARAVMPGMRLETTLASGKIFSQVSDTE